MIFDPQNLKYFLYISDSKLEMLYEQIASAIERRVSIEWKLDGKFASVSRRREESRRENRHEKLATVLNALEHKTLIGTIDDPREYFRGNLDMRWGMFQDFGRPENEPPLVYFGGRTRKTIFGLGGSSRHVVGFQGASSTGSRSSTPSLVGALLKGTGTNGRGAGAGDWNADYDDQDALDAVMWATETLRPPNTKLEFVAKTLLTGKVRDNIFTKSKLSRAVLGTPLYVAMVSPVSIDQHLFSR